MATKAGWAAARAKRRKKNEKKELYLLTQIYSCDFSPMLYLTRLILCVSFSIRQLKGLIRATKGKDLPDLPGFRGTLPVSGKPWKAVDPEMDERETEVVAVDGSQIYPDPAEPLPWAYAHAMVTDPPGKYRAQFVGPGELLREKAARGRKYVDTIRFSLELFLAAEAASQRDESGVVFLDGPVLPPGRTSASRKGLGRTIWTRPLLHSIRRLARVEL